MERGKGREGRRRGTEITERRTEKREDVTGVVDLEFAHRQPPMCGIWLCKLDWQISSGGLAVLATLVMELCIMMCKPTRQFELNCQIESVGSPVSRGCLIIE